MAESSSIKWEPRRLDAISELHAGQLANVLVDCVEGGASVHFMWPVARDRAVLYWAEIAKAVASGKRVLLVAEDAGGICGTVQLDLNQPENQQHRAEVCKMLVHRRARRTGLGAALMRAIERTATSCYGNCQVA